MSAQVEYADGDDATAFAQMLGGLVEANVSSRPEKRRDFDKLKASENVLKSQSDNEYKQKLLGKFAPLDGKMNAEKRAGGRIACQKARPNPCLRSLRDLESPD